MAITFKHDAPGLIGAFAAGQARGRDRYQKYAQGMIAINEQKAQKYQDRMLDIAMYRQSRIDQAMAEAREDIRSKERNKIENDQANARQRNLIDEQNRRRQEAIDDQIRRGQQQAHAGAFMAPPSHATPAEQKKLNEMKSAADQLLSGKEFYADDPNAMTALQKLKDDYSALYDQVAARTPSLQDETDVIDGVRYWKSTKKPVEIPQTPEQLRQQQDAKWFDTQGMAVGQSYLQQNPNATPEQVQAEINKAYEIRNNWLQSRQQPQQSSDVAQLTPQPSIGAQSVLEGPIGVQQQSILEQAPQQPAPLTQPPLEQPIDPRPATIAPPTRPPVMGTPKADKSRQAQNPWSEIASPEQSTKASAQSSTDSPSWGELGANLSGQEKYQIDQFQQLYMSTNDPQSRQAISVVVSPQSTQEEKKEAIRMLVLKGVNVREMLTPKQSKQQKPVRERSLFEPKAKL